MHLHTHYDSERTHAHTHTDEPGAGAVGSRAALVAHLSAAEPDGGTK